MHGSARAARQDRGLSRTPNEILQNYPTPGSSLSLHHLLMPRRLSSSSIDKKTSPSPRAREVPSPPPYRRSLSAISDNSEKGNDSSSSSEDEEERQERQIKKKSLMGLFALTVAIGGAQIVASVLSALVPPLCLSVWNVS